MPLFKSVDESRRSAIEEAILDAAERVVSKRGYEAAIMRDIAREAGCSNGSLYLYFKTKEELFDSLISQHICTLMKRMTERMHTTEDVVDKLRAGCEVLIGYFGNHRGFFKIFFSGHAGRGSFDLGLTGAGLKAHKEFRKFQLRIMEQAQNEGRVRTDIPAEELLAFMQDVAVAALARWTHSADAALTDKQTEALWKFTAGGIGASLP